MESEARGLVRSGALYPRRVGLETREGALILAGFKRGAFSLYFDDEPIFHFDLEGRWQRAYLDGNHFRKALDQSVDLIGRSREPDGLTLRRRARSRIEIDALDDAIRAAAIDVLEKLGTDQYSMRPPPEPAVPIERDELFEMLDRIVAWDASAWFAHKEAFGRVYGEGALAGAGPFVPPDAQSAIVLSTESAEGDPYSDGDFEAHCVNVNKLLGRRVIQANSVYLSGPNALRRPADRILSNLATIARIFPLRDSTRPARPHDLPTDHASISGIEVLFDFGNEGALLPDRSAWSLLAQARIRRVTAVLGLAESRQGDSIACIDAAKDAGVAVSLILPYGLRPSSPLPAMVDVANRLPLGRGDFVHLMEVGPMIAGWDGLSASGDEAERQRAELSDALAPAKERGVKVVKYDPAKQWT